MCGCFGIPILQQFVGFVAANMPAVLFVSGVVTSANLFIGADLLRRRRIEAKERKAFTPPAAVCIPSRAPITARVTLHNDAWWAAHGTPVNIAPQRDAARARRVIDDYNRDANRVEQEWFPVPDENAFAGPVDAIPVEVEAQVDAWIIRAMANERRG